MKTLVIHPSDPTTDFLKEIYINTSWTVINDFRISKKLLIEQIKSHDRIIMLGHGSDYGLLTPDLRRNIIDSNLVYLLREKNCVCIWCNADLFVQKYKLKGFYTGMIVSELEEAVCYAILTNIIKINESNELFATAIKNSIDKPDMVEHVKRIYNSDSNPVIHFNKERLFFR